MAADNFDAALKRLLAHEGGYVNHPSDPGGPTKYGITLATFRKHVDASATADDIRMMDPAHARTIYRRAYWDAMRCDRLPRGVDYAVFDYAVNSGTARTARVLCRLMGVAERSTVSAALAERIAAEAPAGLISRICDERLAFLKSLKTWPVFGTGWSRRVAEVRAAALAMARGDSSSSQSVTRAGAAAGAATGAAVAAEALFGGGAAMVVSLVACVAVLAAAGWLGWRAWRSRKEQ